MVQSDIYIVNITGVGDLSDIYPFNGATNVKETYRAPATAAEDKTFDYEQAINLSGNGCYNCGLLAVLSLGLLGMGIDIFGFSVIVTGSACDFQLEYWQRSIMLSMPFVDKCFRNCSAVQSGAHALLNDSCAGAVRGVYMMIMTSALMLFVLSHVVPAYFILQLNFAYNLGFLIFTPWRLLIILLAAPLGISAFLLHFFYESSKFLVNAGRENLALEYLAKIWKRNGKKNEYPVRKIVLNENLSSKNQHIHFLMSLWLQTIPLFKPPLIWKTLKLFYLTAVIYSINNSLVMWMLYIIEAFTAGTNSLATDGSRSLCSILKSTANISNSDDSAICSPSIQAHTLLSGITHGLAFAGISLVISKLASRKKLLMIMFLLIPALSSLGAVFNENNLASLIVFIGMTMMNLCMGLLFSYYVELYPTSYSGMAACLGVMVSRISGLAGVNFLGSFVITHCSMTLYVFTAYLMSDVIVAMFLPSDTKTKEF